jgi:hypothetical protein
MTGFRSKRGLPAWMVVHDIAVILLIGLLALAVSGVIAVVEFLSK